MRGHFSQDEQVFRRWPLAQGQSIAALIDGQRRGIYVLEFADGDLYVGQSVDVVTRFATHVHGSKHHKPWTDIVAFRFRALSDGDLNAAEMAEIQRLRQAGHKLRNRAGNLGHAQPSPFDVVVSIKDQQHWATGAPNYTLDRIDERITAGQPLCLVPGSASTNSNPNPSSATKLDAFFARPSHQQGTWRGVRDAVIDDLGFLLKSVIPNAVDTELHYWTLSDMPSTNRGRFASLNTGVLELAHFPRHIFPAPDSPDCESHEITPSFWGHLNFPEDTLLPIFVQTGEADCSELNDGEEILFSFEATTDPYEPAFHWFISRTNYLLTPRDTLSLPVGHIEHFLTVEFPELLPLLRKAAISLMRQGSSSIFRRHHSPALAIGVLIPA